MSVYIKGMELPKDGHEHTEVWIYADGTVAVREGIKLFWGKSAIEVPDHGNLIDKDELWKKMMCFYDEYDEESSMPGDLAKCSIRWNGWNDAIALVYDSPVVIPAEKSEQGLKPCPFCGDTAIRPHITGYGGYKIGCNTVNCVGLHCEGKLFESEEEAIESWNRRVE